MKGMAERYRSRAICERRAEIVARFEHPETGAPMVTWYQTSDLRGEDPEFFSASEKEFHSWFEPIKGA